MNIQNLMREAQKMQKELQKTQEELSNTEYEGVSSLVKVVVNGNKDVKSVKLSVDDSFEKDDLEMLEDMIILAFNDAFKKVDADKEKKLGKYGQGLSGLM
jgi:DNA-binding YbaB/EbfC family protein